MTYIPLEYELKTKGKAAVEVVGERFCKPRGALLQSSIFITFPNAVYGNLKKIIYNNFFFFV
jgi:ATP/ADP translocase